MLTDKPYLAHGIRNIYYFMIPCCCLSFFITLFFVKATPLRREDDEKLQEEGKKWVADHKGTHGLGRKKVRAPTEGVTSGSSDSEGSDQNTEQMLVVEVKK